MPEINYLKYRDEIRHEREANLDPYCFKPEDLLFEINKIKEEFGDLFIYASFGAEAYCDMPRIMIYFAVWENEKQYMHRITTEN